jgi:Ca2+-binding EF-hand superfamily protein
VVTLAELREWRDDTPEDAKGRDGGKRHGRIFEDDQSPAEKFKVLDQNGDGRLTASEYAEACKKRFNELDNDNDGTLTESEL